MPRNPMPLLFFRSSSQSLPWAKSNGGSAVASRRKPNSYRPPRRLSAATPALRLPTIASTAVGLSGEFTHPPCARASSGATLRSTKRKAIRRFINLLKFLLTVGLGARAQLIILYRHRSRRHYRCSHPYHLHNPAIHIACIADDPDVSGRIDRKVVVPG